MDPLLSPSDSPGFLRISDLADQAEVTAAQADVNRQRGRGLVRPRPASRGLLRCSAVTVWRRVAQGTFPQPIKIGGCTCWRKRDVLAWMEAQAPGAAPSRKG